MKTIKKFTVKPALPERLKPLLKIAYNLWWTWTPDAIDLFRRIDLDLWTQVGHNPIALLGLTPQETLNELAESESFCSNMDLLDVELDSHLYQRTWFNKTSKPNRDFNIAYFSAEYGLHESIQIYSGGLGVLSGDHLKSADEIGIPLIAVGLAYSNGYFHQFLNADGWQQEVYPNNDFSNMPMILELDDKNQPLVIDIDLPGRKVFANIWRIQVGRVPLYLLDTNIDANSTEDRQITSKLYGGDEEMRIKQEILLGMGGVKALKLLGKEPSVYHMNEGHSAFLSIQRVIDLKEKHGLMFSQAKELVASTSLFTTHTPVPAGLDRFAPTLVDKYMSIYFQKLGVDLQTFLALGRVNPNDSNEPFGMANFAISFAYRVNGVSKLHGEVSRTMWKDTWQEFPLSEVPIGYITNGIHTRSWLSDELTRLFARYLGPVWIDDPINKDVWQRADKISYTELWKSKERLKERLVSFARYKLQSELKRIGAPQYEINRVDDILDPDALTICFARRFATYKRATLLFRDVNRLAKILNNKDQPLQIIFAGKAHPKDSQGKDLIRQIIHLTRDERFRTKVMFIEDYDLNIARYMVQGADIWLNTPRRPLEASGTSGMKAAANGVLNLSVLDGWWDEGYNSENGWAIGGGEEYEDLNYQDEVESNALYDLLEQEIIPLYYRRGGDNLPRGWITRMKESMKTIGPIFNTNRMVKEYYETYYEPADMNSQTLISNNFEGLKALHDWKDKLKKMWSNIKIESIQHDESITFEVGNDLEVRATVSLGGLAPEDVAVELFYGVQDVLGDLSNGDSIPMVCQKPNLPNGSYSYIGQLKCHNSGKYAFSVRVLPSHKDMVSKFDERLICWAK